MAVKSFLQRRRARWHATRHNRMQVDWESIIQAAEESNLPELARGRRCQQAAEIVTRTIETGQQPDVYRVLTNAGEPMLEVLFGYVPPLNACIASTWSVDWDAAVADPEMLDLMSDDLFLFLSKMLHEDDLQELFDRHGDADRTARAQSMSWADVALHFGFEPPRVR